MVMRVLSRIVNRGVCREGIDRHSVPTVASVLIGSGSWLYNIHIQPI